MPKPAWIYTYPWDFYDVGVEHATDQMARAGLNGVMLGLNPPVMTVLSPMNPFRTVHYGEEGVVFFKPAESAYTGSAIRPRASREVDDPDYLTFILENLRARRLEVGAWVSYGLNGVLARENPKSAKVDPFGNAHPAQLSPANRNFRMFALALTEDILAQIKPDELQVDCLGYQPWDAGVPNPQVRMKLSPLTQFLLGLDFSEGTRSLATKLGARVDEFQQEVLARIQAGFREKTAEAAAGPPVTEAMVAGLFGGKLARYLLAQDAAANLLLEDVAKLVRGAKVRVSHHGLPDPLVTGLNLFRLRRVVHRLVVRFTTDLGKIGETVKALRAEAGPTVQILARVDPMDFDQVDGLQAALGALHNAGVDGYSFFNYGMMRPDHLEWIAASRQYWS